MLRERPPCGRGGRWGDGLGAALPAPPAAVPPSPAEPPPPGCPSPWPRQGARAWADTGGTASAGGAAGRGHGWMASRGAWLQPGRAAGLSIHRFIHPSAHPSVPLSVHPSVRASVCPSVHPCVHLPIRLSIHPPTRGSPAEPNPTRGYGSNPSSESCRPRRAAAEDGAYWWQNTLLRAKSSIKKWLTPVSPPRPLLLRSQGAGKHEGGGWEHQGVPTSVTAQASPWGLPEPPLCAPKKPF